MNAERAASSKDDRPMQEIGFLVVMRVPATMAPEIVKDDLRRNIGFGRPEVTLQYVLPETPIGLPDDDRSR
jgi:hypothetical protein